MIDFTHNPIIPADYKSRGRGLPYEASPLEAVFFTWRFQWTAATAPRHTGIAEALRREPAFLRRGALGVNKCAKQDALLFVEQNEQRAGQAQQEGLEQQGDDVKGADGVAEGCTGGNGHQHLGAVGDGALKDAGEGVQ